MLFLPDYEKWQFPAGEVGVRVKSFNADDTMVLDWRSEQNLMVWLQIIDSYNRHCPYWSRDVLIPYLPYGRQDKVFKHGESCALELFIKTLENLKVDLLSFKPHCRECIEEEYLQIKEFQDTPLLNRRNVLTIYPDKHAHIHDWCDQQPSRAITLAKVRSDNEITLSYAGDLSKVCLDKQRALIVDDICDGGKTFIETVKFLRKDGLDMPIDLYVTHGIFSKGLEVLYDAGIDHIYTTNTYCRWPSTDRLTVIDVLEGLFNEN